MEENEKRLSESPESPESPVTTAAPIRHVCVYERLSVGQMMAKEIRKHWSPTS